MNLKIVNIFAWKKAHTHSAGSGLNYAGMWIWCYCLVNSTVPSQPHHIHSAYELIGNVAFNLTYFHIITISSSQFKNFTGFPLCFSTPHYFSCNDNLAKCFCCCRCWNNVLSPSGWLDSFNWGQRGRQGDVARKLSSGRSAILQDWIYAFIISRIHPICTHSIHSRTA